MLILISIFQVHVSCRGQCIYLEQLSYFSYYVLDLAFRQREKRRALNFVSEKGVPETGPTIRSPRPYRFHRWRRRTGSISSPDNDTADSHKNYNDKISYRLSSPSLNSVGNDPHFVQVQVELTSFHPVAVNANSNIHKSCDDNITSDNQVWME